MKKIFFGIVALVAMVATSCQQLDEVDVVGGQTTNVTVNLSTPEIANRAFSDGTTATHLQYAVYDANGNALDIYKKDNETINISKQIEFQLTTGNTYSVLFWAAAPSAPYTVDLDAKTMEVDYTSPVCSDENRDAFYYYGSFTVSNGMDPIDADLKRPFAQLNIGTSDYAASAAAGYTVSHAKVKVPVYTNLDFVSGNATNKQTIEFAYAAIPTSETFPVAGHEYMAMNYLLMNTTKETVDVVFTYATDATGTAAKERTVGAVPVQRNYRTNLYGQLLTASAKVNVEIKPEYDDDNKYGSIDGQVYVKVADAAEFNAAFADENIDIIILTEDIVLSQALTRADEVAKVSTGKSLTIDLNNFTLSATSSATGKNYNMIDVYGTLTVKNGNLEYKHTGDNMVWNNYAEIFHVGENGVLNLDGVTAKNLGGSNMAYVVDLTNAKNITVNIENSTLESTYIPVRVFNNMENGVNNVTIENTTLKGKYCFWVQFYLGDGAKYTEESLAKQLNIDIFGNGNTFEYTGKAPVLYGDSSVIYFDAEGNKTTFAATDDALKAALQANEKDIYIVMEKDLALAASNTFVVGGDLTETVTIEGANHTFNIATSYMSRLNTKNPNAKIILKNLTLNSDQTSGTWDTYDIMLACNVELENVTALKSLALDGEGKSAVLKNVSIEESHDYYALWISAVGQTISIDGLTINSKGRGIKIDEQYVGDAVALVTLDICNSTFTTANKAAILVKSAEGAVINWGENNSIANVAADQQFAVWVDEDAKDYAAKVVVNGANVKVEGESVNIVEANSIESLKTALVDAGSAGAGHTIISLAAGEYTMPSDWTPISVDGYHGADIVTVNGNGAVLKGMTSSLFDGGFAGGSGIVIKDLTIEDAAIVANDTQGYGAFVNCADSMNEITLINCHLINSTIITPNDGADESRLGGLVGWTSGYSNVNDGPVKTYVNIRNCSVVGCTLKGGNSTGGICGHAGASDWTYTTIENCTVKNNTIISTNSSSWRVGVVVGTANVGQVVVNNLIESGNTLTQGALVAPTGVRSYVGRLALNATGTFVVDGVAITE